MICFVAHVAVFSHVPGTNYQILYDTIHPSIHLPIGPFAYFTELRFPFVVQHPYSLPVVTLF